MLLGGNGDACKVALVCENGAKECCGCGECGVGSENEKLCCSVCRKALADGEGRIASVYGILCAECFEDIYMQ